MKIDQLEKLVSSGVISSYDMRTLDMDGNTVADPGEGSRETDELILTFPSGDVLVIGTFCSGCAENTCLDFK